MQVDLYLYKPHRKKWQMLATNLFDDDIQTENEKNNHHTQLNTASPNIRLTELNTT